MKTIALATAVALISAAPALARSGERVEHMRVSHHITAPDPYGVYVDGQQIGRDPDANIRSTLRDEYYEDQSGG